MEHITNAIRACVDSRNWHAALALALTIPDICGQIEYPNWAGQGHTGKRYPKWFDIWVKDRLFRYGQNGIKEFPMSGDDCYALRNAYLHTGVKEARPDGKQGYKFIIPTSGNLANMSTSGVEDDSIVLYVGTESLSLAMCEGAKDWSASVVKQRPDAMTEIDNLLKIQEGEVTVTYTAVVGNFIVTNTSTLR